MTLTKTEQIHLKSNSSLSSICHCAKNLYNEVNYFARQRFFNYGIAPRYNDMDKLMNGSASEPSDNYIFLPAGTAQWVLKTVIQNWKSFFKSIKGWKKHPGKYLGMPRPPKYLEKDGEFILIFTKSQFKFKNGYIHFPKKTGFSPVKTRLEDTTKINQARIVPKGTGYNCEIIYEVKQKELKYVKDNILGIDIGLSNIVTMVNNIGNQPIIIKGGILKSINQFYNKEMSRLQSIKDKQGIISTTKLQRSITQNRKNRIKDQMHKISRFVVNYCIENNIGTIVIGKNDGWKQGVNLGKKTNQEFVKIPHNYLIQMIQYKGKDVSIDVVCHEESYTSKCSFLDNEPVKKHDSYLGTRIKRGLFKTSAGILINADVNAGYNIVRKVLPNAFVDGIGALGLMPVSVRTLANGIENTIKL